MLPSPRFPDLQQILGSYAAERQPAPSGLPSAAPPGFSGAALWKVLTPAGPCALRATPAPQVDPVRLAELHRFLAHLPHHGCDLTPVPIPTRTDRTFFREGHWIWQLEPWFPGTADFATHPSQLRLSAALMALARWHLAAANYDPSDAGRPWFFTAAAAPSPGLTRRSVQLRNWNQAWCQTVSARLKSYPSREFADLGREILALYQRLAPAIAQPLELACQTRVPLQPCLRDIWHDHVLFVGDTVTGLIDPHSACSDCVATDVARLLGSLAGDDRTLWEAGLVAYQSVRPLSWSELTLVELFDASAVLLSGLNWLDWCCLQGRVFEDEARVLARVRAITSRLRFRAAR